MKRSVLTSLAAMGARPALRGVVLDMDGTLTKPNLDFGEMYRRCGVDPSKDILAEIAAMPKEQQSVANKVIEEIEEEGRRTLELMPGASELLQWFASHQIPTALVTRNTRKSADVLTQKLLPSSCKFSTVIPRDDGHPPKPNPRALEFIAEQWGISVPSGSILMVGDSLSNDIAFGKNAGVKTALLDTGRHYQELADGKTTDYTPDFVVNTLESLPSLLWPEFEIEGDLGTFAEMLKVPPPVPSSDLIKAAAIGDLEIVNSMLNSGAEVNAPDDSGNTALIWATEGGHTAVVERLLTVSDIKLDHQGFLGASAVNRAARRGCVDALKLLIDAGCSMDIANEKMQFPLHFAAFQHHADVVELLLERGANPRVLDRKGRTPARDTSNESIRDRLLQATA